MEIVKVEEIDENDRDKFNYYREILKSYSIGELGYIYNGRKNTKLLIVAELVYLKMTGRIKINENGIERIDSGNFSKSEEYIVNNYRFLNDSQFSHYYLGYIESSLKEKNCIENYRYKVNSKMIVSFVIIFFSFFPGWYLALFKGESLSGTNGTLFMAIEMICFLIFWIVSAVTLFIINKETRIVKTTIGKEIYLKLSGLKKFINDFGSFEKKNLNEVALWDEYILYAIILDESKSLTNEAKGEFNELINIIYKNS